ncbi:MAG: ATP-dependent DNA ligase [Nocardioidaceae bacterium]
MDLPLTPPLSPMLAKAVKRIPAADSIDGGYGYEPKWDGFRCIVFRDQGEVVLGSRNERPLTRYFPEVVDAVRQVLPPRCVVDGEIVIAGDNRLDFEALLQRIHPADSRVRRLAAETPATFVAFDLLARDDAALLDTAYSQRRAGLETVLPDPDAPVHLTPMTRDAAVAQLWFEQFEGAGLDGVVAKPLGGAYSPGVRVMSKVKHARTADVVVAGYREHKTSTPDKPLLGSLLLGIYDDAGVLQHVGVSASFTAARRAELVGELAGLVTDGPHPWSHASDPADGDRRPGATSRWNAGKDLSFVPLRPERVVEVAYDHLEGTRFRHTAQFQRWRPDRDPRSCTYDQLEEPVSYDLDEVLRGGRDA